MKKYHSKIRPGILVVLLIVLAPFGHFSFNAENDLILRILFVVTVLFCLHLFFNRKYIIADKSLKIKTGLGRNPQILISKITSIEKTGNKTDSFLGRDLLKITYNNNNDFMQINSPRKKEQFLQDLREINPQIITEKKEVEAISGEN